MVVDFDYIDYLVRFILILNLQKLSKQLLKPQLRPIILLIKCLFQELSLINQLSKANVEDSTFQLTCR